MIRDITETDYPRMIEIWESAVLNTHHFLKQEDFLYYKKHLPSYFSHVQLCGIEESDTLVGFMGTAEDNLEMLFIHNDYRRIGLGKTLLNHAIQKLNITKVDVNEQNEQAVAFYKKHGFYTLKRSEIDGQGKAYPILHLHVS